MYEQPVRNYVGRRLDGDYEDVDYIPQSHIRLWYNVQNESYDLHHHPAMEIIYCIENRYRVDVGDRVFHLNAGDILFIPPHTLHKLEPLGDGIRYICLVDLEPVRVFQDYQVISSIFVGGFLFNAETMPGVYDKVIATFKEMADIYFSNHMLWEGSVYIKIIEIFTLIGREYFRNQVHATGSSEHASRDDYETLGSLLAYIDTHYAEDISLDEAADMSGFSKYYFTRLFKQITDFTFADYVARKRISAAQKMLSTDLPITDIAFQTGFNNLTTFNRSFKKYTGCSPSEYRSRIRNEHFGEIFHSF